MDKYYSTQHTILLKDFDVDAERWKRILSERYSEAFVDSLLKSSRLRFLSLIPTIPYIGGEECWQGSLLESARCLALYLEMKEDGKTASETGQILYDAILSRQGEAQSSISRGRQLSREELMENRRKRAAISQEKHYPEGYVAEFVPGDGVEFGYGYNFLECAAQKFYQRLETEEFLPFFCKLDFAYSQVFGLGLRRTITLAEGGVNCDHRFKAEKV